MIKLRHGSLMSDYSPSQIFKIKKAKACGILFELHYILTFTMGLNRFSKLYLLIFNHNKVNIYLKVPT
jgi:hypothetical protein